MHFRYVLGKGSSSFSDYVKSMSILATPELNWKMCFRWDPKSGLDEYFFFELPEALSLEYRYIDSKCQYI